MDAFGHVNNVAFLRYLEEARIDFLFRLAQEAAPPAGAPGGDPAGAAGAPGRVSGGVSGGVAAGGPGDAGHAAEVVAGWGGAYDPAVPFSGGSVVARHEIDYLRPLVHRHRPVTIETWVTKIGAASATVAYDIKDEDAVYVRASTVIVPFDLDRQAPRRLTREERAFLERYADDSAAGGGRGGEPEAAPA
nr:thioesterase family protein [Streptomyces sp. YIM 98790]